MSDRFEVSLKNKVLRMILLLMVCTGVLEVGLILFTEVGEIVFLGITMMTYLFFFTWLVMYKRKQKKHDESVKRCGE